jgi:hypothetical protein
VLWIVIVKTDSSDNENDTVISDSNSDDDTISGKIDLSDDDVPGPSKRARVSTKKRESDWKWTKNENNTIIHPFSGYSGVSPTLLEKFETEPPSELTIFLEYMQPLFPTITKETNDYVTRQLNNENRKKCKDDENWVDVTVDEIKTYIAVVILMSQVRKSGIRLYWSKNRCLETPIFRETMGRERFKLISRFLHFCNDENSDQNNKLKKLRPVITHFSDTFSKLYFPAEDIVLDESLMKFRGRLSYVQCNRSKRARFGIKIYKICESSSGYCLYFKIYVGDDVTDPSLPASTNVVLNMCEPLFDRGQTLYLDNWYSSPDLFRRITNRSTNVVGTVRPNRRDMPPDISKTKLNRGEFEIWSANNILCLKWRDKDVHLLSSKHKTADIKGTGKLKRKRENPSA